MLPARTVLWIAGCLLFGAARAPAEQPGPDAAEPAWKRVLTGDDLRKVQELTRALGVLEAAGKFAEARAPAEQIADIRRRAQGADHWEAVDAALTVERLKKYATFSEKEWGALGALLKRRAAGLKDFSLGRYPEAEAAAREVLEMRLALFGEDHPDAAGDCETLARALKAQKKLDEAGRFEERALAIRLRVLKENHPETALNQLILAQNLQLRGQGPRAAEHALAAAAAIRYSFGEKHEYTWVVYDGAARILKEQKELVEAERLSCKALEIALAAFPEKDSRRADSHRDLGRLFEDQGRFAEAEPLIREALRLTEKYRGPKSQETVQAYRDLFYVLDHQGKDEEAEKTAYREWEIAQQVYPATDRELASRSGELATYLNGRGKVAEAEKLARRSLDLCRGLEPKNDRLTEGACATLASILMARKEYPEAEDLLNEALRLVRASRPPDPLFVALRCRQMAMCLGGQQKHEQAGKWIREAIAVYEGLNKDDDAALAYESLATCLRQQGRDDEAFAPLERARELSVKVWGETNPLALNCCRDRAVMLQGQGRFAEAELSQRQALATHRRLAAARSFSTADGFYNRYRQLQVDDRRALSLNYLGLAFIQQAQGKWTEAEATIRQGLDALGPAYPAEHPERAPGYKSLALNLRNQGRFTEAKSLFELVLSMAERKHGADHPDAGLACLDLASLYLAQGKPDDAEPWARRAKAVFDLRPRETFPGAVLARLALAKVKLGQGKHSEAEQWAREELALRLQRRDELHPDLAENYNHLALILCARGKYDEAEEFLLKSAKIFETARAQVGFAGLDRAEFGRVNSPFPLLAALSARRGDGAAAWARLERGLAPGLLDDLARPLPPEERRREQQILWKIRQLDDWIAEEAGGDRRKEAERRRDALHEEYARLQGELLQKYGVARGASFDLARVQESLPAEAALVAWVDVEAPPGAAAPGGEHWACVLRRRGEPAWVRLPGGGPEGAAADVQAGPELRQALLKRDPKWRDLAARLAARRLAPLAPHLAETADLPAARHLILLPSEQLSGLPGEVLVEAWADAPRRYTVSYAPSATVFAWLQGRAKAAAARGAPAGPRLLAVGDPAFAPPAAVRPPPEPPDHGAYLAQVLPGQNADRGGLRDGDVMLSYAGERLGGPAELLPAIDRHASAPFYRPLPVLLWRDGVEVGAAVLPGPLGLAFSKSSAADAIHEAREEQALLHPGRPEALAPLAGSQAETRAVAGLFDEPDLLLGKDASAAQLRRRAEAGRLKGYAFLHFATHGRADPRSALRSTLFLAAPAANDPLARLLAGEDVDGDRLTAERILRTWDLDADLVTLSACQTALGPYSGGEGYLGFSQALFLAGARGLVLSLWEVDDEATALLMFRFYENLLGKRGLKGPLPRAAALEEARRWLRSLSQEEANRLKRLLMGGDLHATSRGPVSLLPPSGERPARPYEHPYYWSGFILIGDPGDVSVDVPEPTPDAPPADVPAGGFWNALTSPAGLVVAGGVAGAAALLALWAWGRRRARTRRQGG
jgi:hypothetical protein